MDIRQEWNRVLTDIARYAIRTLDSLDLPDRPAIVFDVDSTLLDPENKVIKPIRTIYHYARMLGLSVIIITSRAGIQEVIDLTWQQLKVAGITDIEFCYFRQPTTYNNWSFKRNSRLNIHERGFTVVMSLGDEPWDIGEYGGVGIIVPKLPIKVPVIPTSDVAYASPLPIVEDHF
jgi:hypothetical protein